VASGSHIPRARPSDRLLRLAAEHARRGVLVALTAAIGLALMMNGAVAAPYRQIAFLGLCLPLLAALATPLARPATRRLWRWSMVCGAVLVAWALLQTVALPFGLLADPVWDTLAELGIPAGRTISVAPAETRAALPALVLPFLVFAAMLLLCQEKREAIFAWKLLAALGLALAGLSAVLEIGFPGVRFFSGFEVGRGAFSGIFVNRNTTAAFLGLVAFATAGWLLLPRQEGGRRHARRDAPERPEPEWSRILLAALLFLVIVALITTRSRAGVTLALLCLTLAVAATLLLQPGRGRGPASQLGPRARAALVLVAGVCVFVVFGEPVISRMGSEAEDGRWCAWASTLQAIAERPLTGFGFATFAEVFPRFRDPDCMGAEGRWLRAHNSHLELLAGMGAVGGLVMAVALGLLLRVLVTGVRRRRSLRAIPVLGLGALAFGLAHSAVDFPLQIPGVALYFAALMGAAAAVSLLSREALPGRSSTGTALRADSVNTSRENPLN
jgi:O-antigen ligase